MTPKCEGEPLQPKDVPITEIGTVPNAFGKFEIEAAAAMVVKYLARSVGPPHVDVKMSRTLIRNVGMSRLRNTFRSA